MKMKDGTECVVGINWEDVELKTFKLDQEIIDEIFETDYSKMDELYEKYKTDSWGYYFKKKDGHPLNDQSDQVSFENSDIRNNLLLGLIRFKQRIESNPPKIIWDSLTSVEGRSRSMYHTPSLEFRLLPNTCFQRVSRT